MTTIPDDPEPKVPRPRRKYSSPGMTERRQRIIERAHQILGEGGVHALTIDRLSREADVAPRTLYRLYGDKEGVIFATVAERLREVRAHIARMNKDYTIDVVFAELDWMVSEMYRDSLYARTVIDFFFSSVPRPAAIRELGSVAYNRFRNWMDREIRAGHSCTGLDLERIAQELVETEFVVYHRWAVGSIDGPTCCLELHANFLKSAILVLDGPERRAYVTLLGEKHRALGMSAIGAAASTNRAERDAGVHFIGKA
ncbi:TetR family transcriptional regulator [Sphingomonas histidinilytica]|jgi:AcrR family transcriptional regulator|uniref:Transcriptional regulator, TetR family n=1 Tax=Rhizorhabdus histidinilytica TaxID=439228 RepID=A0A1T5H0T8_9SPHN|nr:TetR/AcrR family transcriptional regulator [Rhizorhabdus histidinilytica]MBO9375843.1 TetR family transcriptional regulator [Rhizorhabdus histidinilytica]QEH81354.1 TetR/AcrR family transcriptional regulator [Sphingomonas sp. C8-2]SKC14296.1 transcriptional regulator, TetR family [Rhizorhabdus histidinilytica]